MANANPGPQYEVSIEDDQKDTTFKYYFLPVKRYDTTKNGAFSVTVED